MSIALFCGKFQPPHLGHLQTIMSIYDEYDKIIVGITEGPPRIMTKEQVYDEFYKVTKYLPKIELYMIKNTLDDESAIPYLPKDWNVILTGNPYVIDLARRKGWKYRYVPRSEGLGYSGTELRKLYEMEVDSNKRH